MSKRKLEFVTRKYEEHKAAYNAATEPGKRRIEYKMMNLYANMLLEAEGE